MTQLQPTHRTSVTEDQIDHLGHMNVRYYGVAALEASHGLVRALGTAGDLSIDVVDAYTRHFREQMLGADLVVLSTALGAGPGSLRLYHELRNRSTDELAASFVHRLEARRGGEIEVAWPDVEGLGPAEIPEHGRPRSIDLDADPRDGAPTFEQARSDEALALRLPRVVEADECRPDGSYEPSHAPMLVWGGEVIEGATGPVLHEGPDGQRIGWATMEHRLLLHRLPRRGDRIQSFGAVIEVQDKNTHRLMWSFDVERGDLLLTFEVVDVAFDTVSRRAVSIPDDLRAQSVARLRPDLLPRAGRPGRQAG